MSPAAVRCAGLSKAFGSTKAVDGLDLNVQEGEILALLGSSGSGKTTTLRLIAGFEYADAGAVEIGGTVVDGPGLHLPPEKRRVGMVFQDYALFPHMTAAHNIAYGLPKGRASRQRVEEALSAVGLEGLGDRMPHELSGGQQQRVALARAMAPEPKVLLLDEPFSNLHPDLRAQVRAEVREILKSRGATAIFVTHDQQEALFMGDKVAIIDNGRLEQSDVPERIFHSPLTRFVASFMGIADFLKAVVSDGRVETEIGAMPLDQAAAQAVDGKDLEVMVRPDDVVLHPSEQGNGTISQRIFQGGFNLYKVTLDSSNTVHSLLVHTKEYPVGARVRVELDPGHPLLCFVDGKAVAASHDASHHAG